MVRIVGKQLSEVESTLIRLFVVYVLGMFMSATFMDKLRITIRIVHPNQCHGKDKKELEQYKAWMNRISKFSFTITINSRMMYNHKNLFRRMKPLLECLGHELVHVKQYVNGEARDYANGDAWYKGQRYSDWQEDDNYWFSPWELEAYSYEQGLFATFKTKLTSSP